MPEQLRTFLDLFLAREEHEHIAWRLKQQNLHDGAYGGRDVVLLRVAGVVYFDSECAAFDADYILFGALLARLHLIKVPPELVYLKRRRHDDYAEVVMRVGFFPLDADAFEK